MARPTDTNYLEHVANTMRAEFNRIGITITNFNMEHDQRAAMHNGVQMSIEFVCDDNQFKHLGPFCHHSRREHQKTHIMPPVTLYGHEDISIFQNLEYEVETLHHCVMLLNATGGSMGSFMNQFRKATNEIFLKMESVAFDEEVTKLLTKDEYNS